KKMLKESEERSRTLVESSSDAIVMLDRARNVISCNQAFPDLFGYEKDEVVGKSIRFIHQSDESWRSFGEAAYPEIERSGAYRTERDYKRKDGTIISVDSVTSAIKSDDGSIKSYVAIIRDITERKQMENALKEEKNLLRAVIDNVPDFIFVKDTESRYLFSNKAFANFLGQKTAEELVGKSVFEVYPQELAAQFYADDQEVICSGQTLLNREERSVDQMGNKVWDLTTKMPLRDSSGKIVGLVAISKDITDRKRAEEALRESEESYRTLVENVPVGVFRNTPGAKGKFLMTNPAYLKMFGLSSEDELKRMSAADLYMNAEDRQLFSSNLLAKGRVKDAELLLRKKDGSPIWGSVSARIVKDEKGKNVYFDSMIVDITERKRMEEERAQLIKKLQKINEELKDSNQQLQEATVQLIQSEKLSALGELTAGVAHELNQPLNGIKIISQSILRDIEKNRFEEKDVGDDLNEIVSQVNKMAEIIDHMRIYSRNTEGGSEEMIDLNSVIKGPFKLLDQQLKTHNIEVVRELTPDLPKVKGDPIRLEQVFMNLITNARNALDSSGRENKRIEVKTYKTDNHRSAPENPMVVVEVKDNGEGIPEHLREKIFQPFFTTREPGKGTGLGLSVSTKIIEEHRGKIELESKAGKGTTFSVILPVAN
ncbi:MAG: PAS domain S-box protein, partial [Pseudomonadota bacterium]